jgi:hypothetical protein
MVRGSTFPSQAALGGAVMGLQFFYKFGGFVDSVLAFMGISDIL